MALPNFTTTGNCVVGEDQLVARDIGRMPHIASSIVDGDAMKLIRDWIRQLPP